MTNVKEDINEIKPIYIRGIISIIYEICLTNPYNILYPQYKTILYIAVLYFEILFLLSLLDNSLIFAEFFIFFYMFTIVNSLAKMGLI